MRSLQTNKELNY